MPRKRRFYMFQIFIVVLLLLLMVINTNYSEHFEIAQEKDLRTRADFSINSYSIIKISTQLSSVLTS
ncbi:hypothetical protein APQ14_06620 [Vibrio toranzoniae]|uniref:Uncharacterized protein n=1 Tax=Vibrio toranzoniae TaxID=1194427 RepID=A0A109D9I2_9VIBR|nr:hypothetical protein APQ14_06620 [Vibrio toranzoniae]